jgi:acyl carrier protein
MADTWLPEQSNYKHLKYIFEMTNTEKIRLIEDALEIETGFLKEDTLLESIPDYDSMARLKLIVLCDDEFDKILSGEQIRKFRTVKDILDFMG